MKSNHESAGGGKDEQERKMDGSQRWGRGSDKRRKQEKRGGGKEAGAGSMTGLAKKPLSKKKADFSRLKRIKLTKILGFYKRYFSKMRHQNIIRYSY